jgi:hypothetical protein
VMFLCIAWLGSSPKRTSKQNLSVDAWLSDHGLPVVLATTTASPRAES